MSADSVMHSRAGRPADTPTFSVVVTSRGDLRILRTLLAELLPLCSAHGVQAVVVRGGAVDEALALAQEHPSARVLHPPEDASPGAMRSAGMEAAQGDVVLLAADGDPDVPARLLHLLRAHGVPDPGAAAPSGERPRTVGSTGTDPAGGESPARRQSLSQIEPSDNGAWHSRLPLLPGERTGSPRVTGSSSPAPAPAG